MYNTSVVADPKWFERSEKFRVQKIIKVTIWQNWKHLDTGIGWFFLSISLESCNEIRICYVIELCIVTATLC